MASFRGHKPSKEEDDRLFLATGFRFSYASDRGFPFPWCAKQSKKGWVVRSTPPASSVRGTDGEFLGWKAATKMLRSREILMKRVSCKWEAEANKLASLEDGEGEAERPTEGTVVDAMKVAASAEESVEAVDQWFRNTSRAIKSGTTQKHEDMFQQFLQTRVKEERKRRVKELKQKKKVKQMNAKRKREADKLEAQRRKEQRNLEAKRKMDEKEARKRKRQAAKIKKLDEQSPSNITQLPVSPIRKKRKQMTPKRNKQSLTIGDDPVLDEMIEDIVHEFAHEFEYADFDDSAVSALREAARDSLMMDTGPQCSTNHHATSTATGSDGRTSPDNDKPLHSGGAANDESSVSNIANVLKTDEGTLQNERGQDETDMRISAMIEQLIGEASCNFDGAAVEALRAAAKEIAEDDC